MNQKKVYLQEAQRFVTIERANKLLPMEAIQWIADIHGMFRYSYGCPSLMLLSEYIIEGNCKMLFYVYKI